MERQIRTNKPQPSQVSSQSNTYHTGAAIKFVPPDVNMGKLHVELHCVCKSYKSFASYIVAYYGQPRKQRKCMPNHGIPIS